jgi:hypothetical protein
MQTTLVFFSSFFYGGVCYCNNGKKVKKLQHDSFAGFQLFVFGRLASGGCCFCGYVLVIFFFEEGKVAHPNWHQI